MDVKQIAAYLKELGLKASSTRIKVYEYLIDNKNHPTIDTIYSDLIDIIPSLSKTTVYNILATFEEKGIVEPILIEHNSIRYELKTTPHGHFRCDHCHTIYDVPLSKPIPFNLEGDFKIRGRQVYYTGLCPKCANKSFEKENLE